MLVFNSFSPIMMALILRRQDRRAHLARMTSRILLFDACCDLFYAVLPLFDVVAAFLFIFVFSEELDGHLDQITEHSHILNGLSNIGDIKAYMLLSKASEAFFGGTTYWTILVKIKSRVFPLIFASKRILKAFKIKYVRRGEHRVLHSVFSFSNVL